MENLSVYFFIALALSIAFYTYFKKNKVAHPTADEVRVFNPKAPSKPKTKKEAATELSRPTGTTQPSKVDKAGSLPELSDATPGKHSFHVPESSPTPIPSSSSSQNDLENEVKLLQARTGWDYSRAKAYCLQAAEYHQKIAVPAHLKKN
jgi:hypothetical protein